MIEAVGRAMPSGGGLICKAVSTPQRIDDPMPARQSLLTMLLMVCDQIRLSADVLRQLLRLHGLANYPITAAHYGGMHGVPAVFSSIFFPDLLDVSGDRGARGILERNAVRVATVDFLEGDFDLDAPDDLERSTTLSGTAK